MKQAEQRNYQQGGFSPAMSSCPFIHTKEKNIAETIQYSRKQKQPGDAGRERLEVHDSRRHYCCRSAEAAR